MAGRAAFNSRIGFVMAAVGSAVGLGNLWRFPYLTSTNGGATFLILYLVLLFLVGIPALMAELSLGRRSGRNAADAFGEDGQRKGWSLAGYLAIGGAVLLLSYYSVIAGWSVRYMFDGLRAITEVPAYFGDAPGYFADISQGTDAVIGHLVFFTMVIAIVWRGVSRGIEQANLIMMPLLFATVIGLVIYGNLQDGAAAGREFYLEPDFGEIRASTVSNAAGQAFFSIGLGIGTMLTYSSYLGRENDLQRTGFTIAIADTGVAVLAGLMVFPLIFSLGLSELVDQAGGSNVGGLFIAIPTAFASIGDSLGSFLAASFFIMLTFAALSSAISLLEVPVSMVLDRKPHWGRPRAVLLLGLPIYTFGLLSALDLDFLTQADNLLSRVILILGGFLLSIYVGWIRPDLMDEMDVGLSGKSYLHILRPTIRYVLPVLLGALTVLGVLGYMVDIGMLDPADGSFLAELTT
ncbi:MAG: sodium-dependent transporter [Thermoplasmatota archaeon]